MEEEAYKKRIFITAQTNYQRESAFVKKIPKTRHNEQPCVEAKQGELKNYRKFDVIEVTNIEEATGNIIPTEWILIEIEK